MVTVDLIEWGGCRNITPILVHTTVPLRWTFEVQPSHVHLTVSPFNTYTSTRSTLTLFSSHSRSTLHLNPCLHRLILSQSRTPHSSRLSIYIQEHDQIENPILRNNLRVHRYHAHLEQPQITFSLDYNFYNKQPRTLILTV